MIWAAFGWCRRSPLVFVEGKIDTTAYINLLSTDVPPWMDQVYPYGAVIQQNNAPAHFSEGTKEWLVDIELNELP